MQTSRFVWDRRFDLLAKKYVYEELNLTLHFFNRHFATYLFVVKLNLINFAENKLLLNYDKRIQDEIS